jgi:putative transposase
MDWKQRLGSITASVDEALRLRHAYLVAENRLLRQQIPDRVQLTDSERKARAKMGQKFGKTALAEMVTGAKPDTILAWHRPCADRQGDRSPPPKSVGRPRLDKALEDLVMRMAREHRSWGYDRMVGALTNLGYRISDQTVGHILKRHGIPPAPARKTTVTWGSSSVSISMSCWLRTASPVRCGAGVGLRSLPSSVSSTAIVARSIPW